MFFDRNGHFVNTFKPILISGKPSGDTAPAVVATISVFPVELRPKRFDMSTVMVKMLPFTVIVMFFMVFVLVPFVNFRLPIRGCARFWRAPAFDCWLSWPWLLPPLPGWRES